ncbi:phospholipase D family protein [Luteimonas sp. A277]
MVMWRWLLLALLVPALGGCAGLSELQRAQAVQIAGEAREARVDCDQPDTACARPSPLRALGVEAHAGSAPADPLHYVLLMDYGQDALLSRLDLIRSAQRSIELQTYIFDEDDSGRLVLDELVAAARRGVRVRVLVDQLSALRYVDTLAALAALHVNFEMRIYNPVLGRAQLSYPQYVLAAACCWRQLNRRMHNKILLVDGLVGITGGRNYQDTYFDWDDTYNFRDRDILVAGPATLAMAENFEAFWHSRWASPLAELKDVARHLLDAGAPALSAAEYRMPARVAAISRDADDAQLLATRLVSAVLPVGEVEFIADLPDKHRTAWEEEAPATMRMREVIEGARDQVLLQTPYLVLSEPARDLFRSLHAREDAPKIIVSTNSLAATDAFLTYAMSYKYRRRHLREFGFRIYEYKPFPLDAPVDVDATGAVDIAWNPDGTVQIQTRDAGPDVTVRPQPAQRQAQWQGEDGPAAPRLPLEREYSALRWAGIGVNQPVPLRRAGVRVGLHSKSLVVDGRIGVVGTHNFDPRGDNLNTESAVIIADADFAEALADSIRRDISPENSWAIAPRDRTRVLSGLGYSLNKAFESSPVFDFWPRRYATSYQFVPSAECPLPPPLPGDPGFRECHEPVGDFPEVNLGWRSIMTRITTAFGAGLVPIL